MLGLPLNRILRCCTPPNAFWAIGGDAQSILLPSQL